MHKFLLALVLGSSLTYASTINGIAITVNDEPITQYDIEKTMSVNKISKNEAVSYLIDKVLYDQLCGEPAEVLFSCMEYTHLQYSVNIVIEALIVQMRIFIVWRK